MKARIKVTLKHGVLDPQGKAIQSALASLGFGGINDVRQGKYIEVDLAEANEARAREQVERICKELLANTVIENYASVISIVSILSPGSGSLCGSRIRIFFSTSIPLITRPKTPCLPSMRSCRARFRTSIPS